jgi:cytochrome oxidase Cu insertion factor (SCO1/SenC/PrrC family)/thiol-disulfide isomerase/thioredoxin
MKGRRRQALAGFAVLVAVALALGALVANAPRGSAEPRAPKAQFSNQYLDSGTALSGPAPGFTLTDQFGHRVSLSSYRGRVVILAFNDSECTTICPLTTQAMVEAKGLLGRAGADVALLGVNANPSATAVSDVRTYSRVHGMLHQWRFMTGSLSHLRAVWHSYHIQSAIEGGQVDHTPALFVIDPHGRLRRLYLTQQSYAAVGQLGQLLAQEASSLLPGHPRVSSDASYAEIPPIGPTTTTTLPTTDGDHVSLGPGAPRLLFFFATWTQQTLNLRAQFEALNRYHRAAGPAHLPEVVGVDEGSVEPSPSPLRGFLSRLPSRLVFPVAVDQSGRVGDGYEVQDQPWLALVSRTGKYLWYYDVSTAGTITTAELVRKVHAAFARARTAQISSRTAANTNPSLTGSPAPLAAVHAQASQLLGSITALQARLRALRGYPVVLNVWGSWCAPCQAEFPLFGSASLTFGRRVAFLGLDVNDNAGDAAAFLANHPVSYPSYQGRSDAVTPILPQGLIGTPTTVFFNAAGKVANVHTGQYASQGSLNGDIAQYALGSSH